MLKGLLEQELDAELIATFLFIVISGLYIFSAYGSKKIVDALFLWMFPASVMVFLTLLVVKIIERTHRLRYNRERYVELRPRV